jgi:nitrite reductase/ring-hydroxylating ferredoxin subunit
MTAGTGPVTTPAGTTQTTDPGDADFLSRRTVFAVGSAGALALCLAACGGSSDASETGTVPAPTVSDDGAGSSATTTTTITKLSAVPVGGALGLTVSGKPIIVSQPTEGKAVAFSAVCPHQGGIVAVDGKELKCPLHGSTFADATGANLSGPAAGVPLTPIAVDVVKGNVVLNA